MKWSDDQQLSAGSDIKLQEETIPLGKTSSILLTEVKVNFEVP